MNSVSTTNPAITQVASTVWGLRSRDVTVSGSSKGALRRSRDIIAIGFEGCQCAGGARSTSRMPDVRASSRPPASAAAFGL